MSHSDLFRAYLRDLFTVAQQGDAREESYYPALATMVAEMARVTGRRQIHVTTLPKPTDAGNPDFRVWNGKDRIVGYIEAKNPTEARSYRVTSRHSIALKNPLVFNACLGGCVWRADGAG